MPRSSLPRNHSTLNFGDCSDVGAANFPPIRLDEGTRKRSVQIQSAPLDVRDKSMASVEFRSIGVQTGNPSDEQASEEIDGQTGQAGVEAFVSEQEQAISDVLEENLRVEQIWEKREQESLDPAFHNVSGSIDISLTLPLGDVSNSYGVQAGEGNEEGEGKLVPTCMSWSCQGFSLAVSLGRVDVPGWCSTPGMLAVWATGRPSFDPSTPTTRYQTHSCLQSIAFHPHIPALIAGGTINGDVLLFDLRAEGDLLRSRSKLSDVTHREAVTALRIAMGPKLMREGSFLHCEMQVRWKQAPNHTLSAREDESSSELVSLSGDGRVLIWRVKSLHQPLYGYELRPLTASKREIVWGGTCFDFSRVGRIWKEARSVFVAGTEAGSVIHGNLTYSQADVDSFKEKQASEGAKMHFRNPVKGENEPHHGPVQAVSCSPFHRNIFATCATDSTVRLYSLMATKPITMLEPTSEYMEWCAWSVSRPLVLFTASSEGNLSAYDLTQSRLTPAASVDATGGTQEAVQAVALDGEAGEYVASASGSGDDCIVRIWHLSPQLTKRQSRELRLLEALAGKADNPSEASRLLPL